MSRLPTGWEPSTGRKQHTEQQTPSITFKYFYSRKRRIVQQHICFILFGGFVGRHQQFGAGVQVNVVSGYRVVDYSEWGLPEMFENPSHQLWKREEIKDVLELGQQKAWQRALKERAEEVQRFVNIYSTLAPVYIQEQQKQAGSTNL